MPFSHSIFKSEITLIVLLKIFQRKIVKQYITIIFKKTTEIIVNRNYCHLIIKCTQTCFAQYGQDYARKKLIKGYVFY